MATAAQSKEAELAEDLLRFFVGEQNKECFAACLYTCYDLIKPDVAVELAWMNGMTEMVMPYMIQFMREYSGKVDTLIAERDEAKRDAADNAKAATEASNQSNMYAQMLPPALPAPMQPQQGMDGMGYGGMPPGSF